MFSLALRDQLWHHSLKRAGRESKSKFPSTVNPHTVSAFFSALTLFPRPFFHCAPDENDRPGRQGGGRCLEGNRWFSPPASMTSRLATVTFKIASKVFIEETDKNFEFPFLEFGDFEVPLVIEN